VPGGGRGGGKGGEPWGKNAKIEKPFLEFGGKLGKGRFFSQAIFFGDFSQERGPPGFFFSLGGAGWGGKPVRF